MSKNEILEEFYTSDFVQDTLKNITRGNPLINDLKQEIFIILFSMNGNKIKKAHRGNWLKYLFIRICENQYKSNTSPFHKKYRSNTIEINNDLEVEEIEYDLQKDIDSDIFRNEISKFLNTLSFVDSELFKIYYKLDEYDKHNGIMRDESCNKDTYSFDKIEKLLTIHSTNGRKIKMARWSIMESINSSKDKFKKWMK